MWTGWVLLGAALVLWPANPAQSGERMRQEIPSRFAPVDLLRPAVKRELSPRGQFVILPEKGSVLVIDHPANLMAAAQAIEDLDIPTPRVQLGFGLETGGKEAAERRDGFGSSGVRRGTRSGSGSVRGPVQSYGFAPFPTGYLPPRVIRGGTGGFIVVPAHPTGFRWRTVGQRLETRPTLNPDGSITLDIQAENTEFLGFINYGSPILPTATRSVIPVNSGLRNAPAFRSFVPGGVNVPIFETTRISTSVVVYPKVEGASARVHFMPRLTLENEIDGKEEREDLDLNQFRSQVAIRHGDVARVDGFQGAPEEFNELFFAPEDEPEGRTRMVFKARILPGTEPAVDTGKETAPEGAE